MSVWAVVYSNYEPAEVDSLWATEELANIRLSQLLGDWTVVEWAVGTEPREG